MHLAGQWFLSACCLELLVASLQHRKDQAAGLELASLLGSWGAPAAGYGFTEPLGWNFWELSMGGGGPAECTKQGALGGSSARITAAFAPARVEVGSSDGCSHP